MADQRGEYPRRPHRIGCAVTAKSIVFPAVPLFPQETGTASAIFSYDLSRENAFSAEYAQSKAEGIPIRPTLVQGGKPGCAAGAQPAVQQ